MLGRGTGPCSIAVPVGAVAATARAAERVLCNRLVGNRCVRRNLRGQVLELLRRLESVNS